MKKISFYIGLFLASQFALMAQVADAAKAEPSLMADLLKNGISSTNSVYFLTGVVFVFFLLIIIMLFTVNNLLHQYILQEKEKNIGVLSKQEIEEIEISKLSLMEKLLQLKPLSTEKDKLMHHKYDGIAELDNPTPPWFMFLFYLTIVFAVVYIYVYHFSKSVPLQHEEFLTELKVADEQHAEYLKNAAGSINETNAVFVTSKPELEDGKALFVKYCVACHGAEGQGTVGPNFTDNYWIHGNKPTNLFKVVSDGVPSKGMVSWKKQLNGLQIQNVISYVATLKGTNPANPKAPQGDLFE